MEEIEAIYEKYPFYGSRKIAHVLRKKGFKINRKRVQRLMRKMNIQAIYAKPNLSKSNKEHRKYPYLLKDMDITAPNQVWCTDITYLKINGKTVYLMAIMDWYSKYVFCSKISKTMDEDFCVELLEQALKENPKPLVFNTDQGSQYTSKAFTDVLLAHDIKISMDGKGRALDNIMIERLWRSYKYEEYYLNEYRDLEDLSRATKEYFEYYNRVRPHQTHEYKTPLEVHYGFVQDLELENLQKVA